MVNNILEATKIINSSKYIVAVTGAGISVDSGVPTFQGTDGLWTRFGKPSLNSYSDFIKDPDKIVKDLITESIATLGENISVGRYIRYAVGESNNGQQ